MKIKVSYRFFALDAGHNLLSWFFLGLGFEHPTMRTTLSAFLLRPGVNNTPGGVDTLFDDVVGRFAEYVNTLLGDEFCTFVEDFSTLFGDVFEFDTFFDDVTTYFDDD